jgi:hypothetical protein
MQRLVVSVERTSFEPRAGVIDGPKLIHIVH